MKSLIKNIIRNSIISEAKKTFFRRVSLPYDYNSLKDFLDPNDITKTAEGHPAPLRATIIANI